MLIGELSRRTGVSERSLRYYQQQGLLTAEGTASGQREFPESEVERVLRIRELFAAGLCSGKIAQLLPCVRVHGGSRTAPPELVAVLLMERARIDGLVRGLLRSRELLDQVIAEARPAD
ncbi:MerR family transcriptional regulator [Streptomyces orinoci]|uniref:MerR family transcriptional regulator n=1 Tax=Streptomyces orinoci TaxID=67339 RepID=A0ABV3JQZ5_STRON|nr:MerR family transcriptional regulator [Streptomyces orinoci]